MFYQGQHFGISEYFCREMGENFSFPAHMHHSYEFITLLEGEMNVVIGEMTYELTAGEGVLIFPEEIHSLKSERSRHLLVIFSSDIVSAYHSRHPSELPKNRKITLPEHLTRELSALDESSSVIRIKGALYTLCAILDGTTEYEKRQCKDNGLLRVIFEFVEQNYAVECTLSALGKALGYNSAYLSRYFVNTTGMSFTAYVNRYKIGRACYLLRNSQKSVLECAYESGYRSLRNFNRNFKAIIGASPVRYRTDN